jgi:phytoene/squalene synthetase
MPRFTSGCPLRVVAGRRGADLESWSDDICTALQLTNFWQDLEIDWRKGRLYVPLALVRQNFQGA